MGFLRKLSLGLMLVIMLMLGVTAAFAVGPPTSPAQATLTTTTDVTNAATLAIVTNDRWLAPAIASEVATITDLVVVTTSANQGDYTYSGNSQHLIATCNVDANAAFGRGVPMAALTSTRSVTDREGANSFLNAQTTIEPEGLDLRRHLNGTPIYPLRC